MSLSPAPVIPAGILSHSAQPTLVSPDGGPLSRHADGWHDTHPHARGRGDA
ncbi:hypothetical protein [Streptomyces buecherae]|uniref:hypothetical protein n=1 Tax=Streptomyces buecherae TaxID=2763006 RepID=UPI0036B36D81